MGKNLPFEGGELEDKYQSLVQCTSDPLTAGIMKVSVKDYEAEATRNLRWNSWDCAPWGTVRYQSEGGSKNLL